jgi:crotonobetainyl-CoA:carnitine CoA-transferase CaiB-like acyl-CoA transferase
MPKTLAKKSYEPGAKGTLEGVRVLDLSRLVAGNMLTQVLGDFGAEVIKVEPPAGDTLGEHNRELLAGLGVDDAEYSKLLAAGVACEGSPAKEEEE